MMLTIISVGSKTCPEFQGYAKRITRWKCKLLTYSKPPIYTSLVNPQKEAIFILDERGQHFTSAEFAHFMNKQEQNMVFLVGGAEGFPKNTYQLPHTKVALSYMTLPHEWARILLIEQIYRAQQIIAGHPYHKA